jgi:hypothetical protein
MNATKLSTRNAVPSDVVAESIFPRLAYSAFSIIMQKNKDCLQKSLVVYVTKKTRLAGSSIVYNDRFMNLRKDG